MPVIHESSDNTSDQADTGARSKPDVAEDQGAFWTPDDVGVAYDLSDPDEDQSAVVQVLVGPARFLIPTCPALMSVCETKLGLRNSLRWLGQFAL